MAKSSGNGYVNNSRSKPGNLLYNAIWQLGFLKGQSKIWHAQFNFLRTVIKWECEISIL